MGVPLYSENGVMTAAAAPVVLSSCPRVESFNDPTVSVAFLALFAGFLFIDWAVTVRALWSSLRWHSPADKLRAVHW